MPESAEGLGVLIAVIAAGLNAFAAIRSDPRIDGVFIRRTIFAMTGYFFAVAAVILAMVSMMPDGRPGEGAALAAAAFVVAGIAWASLWLIRYVPRLKEPPAILMRRWGPADWTLIAAAGAAFVVMAAA